MYRSAALLLISIALAPALGAETPWEKADYGPCLSFAMDVSEGKLKDTIRFADTRNYVFRARVISLDGARQLNIVYDTELMRVERRLPRLRRRHQEHGSDPRRKDAVHHRAAPRLVPRWFLG